MGFIGIRFRMRPPELSYKYTLKLKVYLEIVYKDTVGKSIPRIWV